MYGVKIGNMVMLTDAASGKPIVETSPPTSVPSGYHAEGVWVDTGEQLMLVYDVLPDEGTAEQAALDLSRMQFMSLPDEVAYEFRALAQEYVDGMTCYGEVNAEEMPVTRVKYAGELYRFIGAGTQVMQPGWNPVAAPSLWARILPGQEGSGQTGAQPWERPGSTNGYSEGVQVTHNGHLWTSLADDNVDEPGTDNGFRWKDEGPVEGGEA